ncbi:ArnT family glycosyltransferase [Flavihumibacter profundi]|uniref:ArnT family glycosyltransferase n=1 Tax=Flavihumibacter profundi TaxID=2716883 RepID=UPI001CC5420B|nr:glycosyltransferase family 39 protein [Flavihumibacter profundi]MBZ5858356.1 glycosyltransferase family 39 protein [Flavihumibacter profundi]
MNPLQLNFKRPAIWLIVLTTLLKLILAGWVELNNDEAYYWTYATKLQWNYFDHPPIIAVLLKYTRLPFFHHEFFLRLPFVLFGAGSCWMVFKIGSLLKDEFTGLIGTIICIASFYVSILAGMLVLPDAPMVFFWLLAAYLLLEIISSPLSSFALNFKLLLVGVVIALCILSKVQGVFLWGGFGAYLVFRKHPLLKNPFLYISILVSLLLLIPSSLWSVQNSLSNINYHQSRIHFNQIGLNNFITELFGEILYNNPIIWGLLVYSFFFTGIKNQLLKRPDISLLLWLSLPLIATVLVLSLFNSTLPHWNGPGYSLLIPIVAFLIREKTPEIKIPGIVKFAAGFIWTLLICAILLVNYFPGSLGKTEMPKYGKDDVTLDMAGWRDFANTYKSKFGTQYVCILTDYWFPAGHLNFYLAPDIPVIAVGNLPEVHHFAWINADTYTLKKGDNACFISVSNFYSQPKDFILKSFDSVSQPILVPQFRSGKIVRYFYIYPLTGYRGGIPANGVLENIN